MGDFCGGLFFFFIGLSIFMAIGHGLWVATRAMLRGLFGQRCGVCQMKHLGFECPRCASMSHVKTRHGDTASSKQADITADVHAAVRLVRYAEFRGWLVDEKLNNTKSLVNDLADRIRQEGKATEQATQVAVSAPSVIHSERGVPGLRTADSQSVTTAPIQDKGKAEDLVHRPSTTGRPVLSRQDSEIGPEVSVKSTVHPLDQIIEPEAQTQKQPPMRQRLTAGLLRSFMEQSNIRWVELISASLIVVCSVGLVISLWSTLSRTSRFFPSLVFLVATVAVHGAGQYTLRQWKLRSTSRGVLHIGLMLIPLSVLVGILLSRRPDALPQFDVISVSVLALGTVVYGALAITASQALFGRRYRSVAASTIVASGTLVAIHVLAQYDFLLATWAPLSLLPLGLVTVISSTRVTLSSLGAGWQARSWRILGMVSQALFATLVVLGFWGILNRNLGAPSVWFFGASGVLLAVWASWGWSVSLGGFGSISSKVAKREGSGSNDGWLIVVAWLVGITTVCYCSFSLWKLSGNYIHLAGALALLSVWWCWFGKRCGLLVPAVLAGVAGSLALSLVFEAALVGEQSPVLAMWISWKRAISLAASGVLGILVGVVGLKLREPRRRASRLSFLSSVEVLSSTDLFRSLMIGGTLLIAVSAILPFIAIFVNSGETPYGGNWAPSLLSVYGIVGLTFAVYRGDKPYAFRSERWLVPCSLLVLIASVLSFTQTSPWFSHVFVGEVLGELRPNYSWAIGCAGLAVVWSVLAASIRTSGIKIPPQLDGEKKKSRMLVTLDYLGGGAAALAVLSGIALWARGDQLVLASWTGWFLPCVAFSLFLTWRKPVIREVGIACSGVWLCSLLGSLGLVNVWWQSIGWLGTASAFAILLAVLASSFELVRLGIKNWQQVEGGAGEKGERNVSAEPTGSWLTLGDLWAIPFGLMLAGGLAVMGLIPVVANGIAVSMGFGWNEPEVTFFTAFPNSYSIVLAFFACVITIASTLWIAGTQKSWLLKTQLGIVPLVLACLAVISIPLGNALAVASCSFACWLIGSELARFLPGNGRRVSGDSWRRLVDAEAKVDSQFDWLTLSRGLSVAGLGAGVLFAGLVAMQVSPPEVFFARGAAWGANCWGLLPFFGPLLCFGLVRWSISNWDDEKFQVVVSGGLLASLAGAAISSLALPMQVNAAQANIAAAVIAFGQSFALIGTILAWLPITFITARNFYGLRSMFSGKLSTAEILRKSVKGGRWQRSEKASWCLNTVSMTFITALCAYSAIAVVCFPVRSLPGLVQLSEVGVSVTAVLTLLLFSWLAGQRKASKFGITAGVLALIAPLMALGYASWLIENPGQFGVRSLGFYPYRTLIFLWLGALSIGLAARCVANWKGLAIKRAGEYVWIALGVLVASLSLVSTLHDPGPIWPCLQLSWLALVSVLSGVVSGERWRGHVAALAAGIGLWTWLGEVVGREYLAQVWLTMVGPLWVAWVALVAHLVQQRWVAGDTVDARKPLAVSALWASVDRSVSLQLPVASSLLSLLLLLIYSSSRTSFDSLYWYVLAFTWVSLGHSIVRLWDQRPGQRGVAVYLNLVAVSLTSGIVLSVWSELPAHQASLLWLASGLGAMALMAGALREFTGEASRLGAAFHVGAISYERRRFLYAAYWMRNVHTIAALLALVPSVYLVTVFGERSFRVAATVLPFIGALTILPVSVRTTTSAFRYVGLSLISFTLLLFWWADLPMALADASHTEHWIFIQRAFAAFVALGIAYPAVVGFIKNRVEWEKPLMDLSWIALLLGLFTGGFALLGQWQGEWRAMGTAASMSTKALTLVAWIAVFSRLIQFAAKPFGLDKKASIALRKAAVFAAEFVLGLLCAAAYLFFPDLFSGVVAAWWPMIVFGIAMVSAGVGAWLHRIEQPVLADPVRQSSLLLPLIPLAGVWWIQPPAVDWFWSDWGRYGVLLLTASGLYGFHGWVRQSIWLRGISGALILLSFWSFLHSQPDLRFFAHPQFWLMPPALATLVFTELNRRRLSDGVVTATRYFAVLVAYLSSTAEIFFKAFEGQLWQPMLLLTLALCGVAAGIVLRVRAFLYCGSTFTLVALLAMVWHAQQAIGEVWPWWVFGIVTGICLIVLLGYFEKNRPRVIAYLEGLRSWDQ